jgi:hypothetical protein
VSRARIRLEVAAVPRTYVRVQDDGVERFDEAAFVRALREGRAFGTTGPLVDARLEDAGLGETFRGGEGVLRVEVRAAGWVPVEEIRVFVNGELAHGTALAAPVGEPTPIFVDADEDGVWSAPRPEEAL